MGDEGEVFVILFPDGHAAISLVMDLEVAMVLIRDDP